MSRAAVARRLAALDRRSATVHRLVLAALKPALRRRLRAAGGRSVELTLRHPHGGEAARLGAGAQNGAVRIAIASDDLILLAGGAVSWPKLFARGRLELRGDPFRLLQVTGALGLPAVPGRR